MDDFNHTTAAVDDLQSTFKCCGAEGFEDWRHSSWWRSDIRYSNKVLEMMNFCDGCLILSTSRFQTLVASQYPECVV